MKQLNKTGQSIITAAFGLVIVGVVWLVGLAGFISSTAATFISANNITGLEAFVYANTNLWIGLFYILAWVVLSKIS